MSDHSELKRLADTLLAIGHREDFGAWIAALEAFEKASGPEAVLALLAENEALRGLYRMHKMTETREMRDVKAERDQLKAQVKTAECRLEVSEDTLQTIRGCLRSAEGDIDQLKAEVDALRKAAEQQSNPGPGFGDAFYKVAEMVGVTGARPCSPMEVFKTEIVPALEAAVKDAERYRWLRIADWWLSPLCAISNPKEQAKLGSDCPSGDRLDAQIDAAMSMEACQ